jgi:hypothetical protein
MKMSIFSTAKDGTSEGASGHEQALVKMVKYYEAHGQCMPLSEVCKFATLAITLWAPVQQQATPLLLAQQTKRSKQIMLALRREWQTANEAAAAVKAQSTGAHTPGRTSSIMAAPPAIRTHAKEVTCCELEITDGECAKVQGAIAAWYEKHEAQVMESGDGGKLQFKTKIFCTPKPGRRKAEEEQVAAGAAAAAEAEEDAVETNDTADADAERGRMIGDDEAESLVDEGGDGEADDPTADSANSRLG